MSLKYEPASEPLHIETVCLYWDRFDVNIVSAVICAVAVVQWKRYAEARTANFTLKMAGKGVLN